ncbi:MAG TPA: VTT domain-containing protein [Mycobacteriales bacterium]|nr:VTT domain-containing protein [Mycobacteriales bacterium]
MHHPMALLGSVSASHLLSTFGVIGVFVILAAETGLLIGFFLPGDSLLFLAGYATDHHNTLGFHMPLGWLLIAAVCGGVLGAQGGYEIGRRAGPALHDRPEGRLYRREYVERADRFLARFGFGRTIVLGRFVPIVRTLVFPLIGVAGMRRHRFAVVNLLSGIVWVVPIILLGHWIGHVSFIRRYIEVIAVAAVVLSVLPMLVHLSRTRRRSA